MESSDWGSKKELSLLNLFVAQILHLIFFAVLLWACIGLMHLDTSGFSESSTGNITFTAVKGIGYSVLILLGFRFLFWPSSTPRTAGYTGHEPAYRIAGGCYICLVSGCIFLAGGTLILLLHPEMPEFLSGYGKAIPIALMIAGPVSMVYGTYRLVTLLSEMKEARVVTQNREEFREKDVLPPHQTQLVLDIREAIKPWIDLHSRPAWNPETDQRAGEVTDSKFGGVACLAEGEEWPTCTECGTPMPLVLQLNARQVPDEVSERIGEGLLQLFCCNHEECRCYPEPRDAFSRGHLIRRIPVPDTPLENCPHQDEATKSEVVIRSWTGLSDEPTPFEHEECELEFMIEDDLRLVIESKNPVLTYKPKMPPGVQLEDFTTVIYSMMQCSSRDKLGGNPCWDLPQNLECPECGTRMELLFQFSPDGHSPVRFDDICNGFLMQCPEHRDVLSFQWPRKRELDAKVEENRRKYEEELERERGS